MGECAHEGKKKGKGLYIAEVGGAKTRRQVRPWRGQETPSSFRLRQQKKNCLSYPSLGKG